MQPFEESSDVPDGYQGCGMVQLRVVGVSREGGVHVIVVHNTCFRPEAV